MIDHRRWLTRTVVEEVVLKPSAAAIEQQVSTVQQLADAASKHPFYKYNGIWQRDIQNLITSLQIRTWLETKELITIEQVGSVLKGKQEPIPADLYETLIVCLVLVNLKDRDAFHLTIEDYLLALTNTIEELARLAPNSVTLGDYGRPLQISKFIKDIHAGFQLLNLKNDALRRRSDTIKYSVS